MSMLAEPRKKKAWILNPRRSEWAEDDNKFGTKMLEQMGWSKGKGLGKKLTGITEHIRPAVQNDSRGLGYEGRSDDWVAHLDDFNDILASLQQDQKDSDKDAAKPQIKSLEERSKKSRARVHYHKFTRGKDLSRYSERDLACLVGGRTVSASQPVTPVSSRPPSPPQTAGSEPASEAETEPTPGHKDESFGYTTISTGVSVKDYFAEKMKKMAMLRKKNELGQNEATVSCEREHVTEINEAENKEEADMVNGGASNNTKTKKKKKKRSRSEEESTGVEESTADTNEPKKKKKKKQKDRDSETDVIDEMIMEEKEEKDVSHDGEVKRKKKKRKGCEIDANSLDSACEAKKKRKKGKSNDH